MKRHLRSLALLAAALSAPAHAQSILASRGLGYTLEPIDARSLGMGGGGGAPGVRFSLINPSASAGIQAPAASVTFQNDWYDATAPGTRVNGGTARFPLIALAFPITPRWSASLAYGSFLDQNWGATVSDSMDLSTGRVAVADRYVSEGAVARARAGVAFATSAKLAVGVAAELYTGALRDTLVRQVGDLTPVFFAETFRYSGAGISAGVRWNPLEALNLSASIAKGGNLTASSEDSASTQRKSYPLPLTVDAGGMARIARQTELAASVHWAGWSDANDALAARGGARDALTISGGVEYGGLVLLQAPVPVRLGARVAELPFRWQTDAFATERAVTGGWGLRLAHGTAQLDFGVERGWRGGGDAGFDEPYWRGSASISILGR
jgi:hypothetical protein